MQGELKGVSEHSELLDKKVRLDSDFLQGEEEDRFSSC
jgi:hypothetical protein